MDYLRFLLLVIFPLTITDQIQPVIDGKFSREEWQGAHTHSLKGAGTAFTVIDNNTLYVAMVGHAQGWSHVYLIRNDTLNLLHASAALGMSRYVHRNDSWENIQKFNWALRDRLITDQVIRKMDEHYNTFGWVANNSMMSKENIIEFKINLQKLSDARVRVAFVFASDSKDPHHFPEGLKDDTINSEVLYGGDVQSIKIHPDTWLKL